MNLEGPLKSTEQWPKFKDQFILRFGKSEVRAQQELFNRVQGKEESVRAYGEKMRSLTCSAKISLGMASNFLRKGFRAELRYSLANGLNGTPSFDEILEAAYRVELEHEQLAQDGYVTPIQAMT